MNTNFDGEHRSGGQQHQSKQFLLHFCLFSRHVRLT
jgi:hypothetical protein